MMRSIPKVLEGRANGCPAAPLEVFYVVETTGQVDGERKHRVCSALFQTRPQAFRALEQLRTTNGVAALSIWKGTTYIEPARWSYDVVLADGTVVPAGAGISPCGPLPGRPSLPSACD